MSYNSKTIKTLGIRSNIHAKKKINDTLLFQNTGGGKE